MKTAKVLSYCLTATVLIAIAIAQIGCEDSPDGGDIDAALSSEANDFSIAGSESPGDLTIEPDEAQVTHIGQRIEFEVKGGHHPYSWSVADTTRGTINVVQSYVPNEEFTAVYTANEVAANSVIVTDASGRTGVREITASGASGPTLTILPSAAEYTMSNVVDAVFLTVVGGTPPYTWATDSTTTNITISANTGSSVTVNINSQAGNTGDYYVYVTDEAENSDEVKFTLTR